MKNFTDYLEIVQEMEENKEATKKQINAMVELLSQEPTTQIISNLLADKKLTDKAFFNKWYTTAQGKLVQKLGDSGEEAWNVVQKSPTLKKLWEDALKK